jgi:hypothetical protein
MIVIHGMSNQVKTCWHCRSKGTGPLTHPENQPQIVAARRRHWTALVGCPRKLIDVPAYGTEFRNRALQLQ